MEMEKPDTVTILLNVNVVMALLRENTSNHPAVRAWLRRVTAFVTFQMPTSKTIGISSLRNKFQNTCCTANQLC